MSEHSTSPLGFNITADGRRGDIARRRDIIRSCPHARHTPQMWKLGTQDTSCWSFDTVHNLVRCKCCWSVEKQMNMVNLNRERYNSAIDTLGIRFNQPRQPTRNVALQHFTPAPGYPDKVVIEQRNGCVGVSMSLTHRPYCAILLFMRATYIYKIYRHKRNWRLHRQINVGGEIHNHCIRLCKAYYKQYRRTLSFYTLKRHITNLKKLPQYAHWKQLGSQAIQDIVFRIKKGYEKFFRKENRRPPTYRKIAKAKSFTLTQAGWKLAGNRLRVGKGNYKIALSRPIEGKVKTVTIKRDATGDLSAHFSLDIPQGPINRTTTGKSAGFDFGLKTFLVGSDGAQIHAPQPLRENLAKLKRANRSLSRKRKGSGHRKAARLVLAKLHRKIRNARAHWHWSLARQLCLAYDEIQLEDLNLLGMKRLWGRKMSDLGHGNFVRILKHVASKLGTKLTFIDRWFPSSKLCHVCGIINESLTLKDREWTCSCGTHHDRDENAAINIHRAGTGPSGVGHVRQATACNGCLIPESHAFMRAE